METVKTLYLLRHAKSSWADLELADHDRPLSPRGHKAAQAMATVLTRARPLPMVILCSSALRALQTLEPILAALDPPAELRVEQRLYGADVPDLLGLLRELPEDRSAALVVGHNPGLQDLAVELADEGGAEDLRRLREKFPTGALATLGSGGQWAELGAGRAYLAGLVLPRELAG